MNVLSHFGHLLPQIPFIVDNEMYAQNLQVKCKKNNLSEMIDFFAYFPFP